MAAADDLIELLFVLTSLATFTELSRGKRAALLQAAADDAINRAVNFKVG